MSGCQEVDSVWRAVKPWGKYQFFQLFLTLVDSVPACFAILSAVFTGFIPDFTCDVPEESSSFTNGSLTYDVQSCKYDVVEHVKNFSTVIAERTCDQFTYSYDKSYASEWDLVCSRANLAALAQSLALAGQGLGAMIMSHVADRFGRKTVHVISHLGVMFTMIVMAFSQNIYMLLSLRLIGGTFQQGIICTGKIIGLEMFPKEMRSHSEAASFISWSVGIMVLTLYGYLFQDINWRYLQLGLAAFSFYALFEWWMLDESLRWLVSNGRMKEAKVVLRKAARWNNTDVRLAERALEESIHLTDQPAVSTDSSSSGSDSSLEMKSITCNEKSEDAKPISDKSCKPVEKYTVIDILKNPDLRINTFILWYSWIVATGTYYGMTLVSAHLAGDRFVNFFLSGVIEVPALMLEFYLFNKIGRKRTMILFFATAGISLVVSTALLYSFPDSDVVSVIAKIFSLVGKSASTGCFSTVFLYTPEIYPTNYRNSGLGIASSISRIGGILAPFASNLALIALWIPGAIFGSMCMLVVILAMRLPESAKHELPGTIAECNTWKKRGQAATYAQAI